MKRLVFLLGLSAIVNLSLAQIPCVDGFSLEWPCENVSLMRFIPLEEIGGGPATNDIWGWVDELTGREFALVCKRNGMSVVEITDPLDPIYMGTLATETEESVWRDVKVHNNHAYVVADNAGEHGLQVLELTQFLDVNNPPFNFQATAVYSGFGDAHNIVINEESGYAYAVGTDTFEGGLHVLDLTDPLVPMLVGSFEEDGYTHDAQVVNYQGPDADYQGHEIAFCFNEDNVAIVDVTDKEDIFLISHAVYEEVGYTHQGWLTEDHTILLVDDETDELATGNNTRTFIFNVEDLDNPSFVAIYEGTTTAIDHNQYVVGNFSFQSNYRAGLRIADIADVANGNMSEVAYFDVAPDTDEPGFTGSWSNYAWFPSGNVICTDVSDGFFILRPTIISVEPELAMVSCVEEVVFTVSINADIPGTFSVAQEGLNAGVVVTADDFTAEGNTEVVLTGLGNLQPGLHEFEFVLTSEFGDYRVEAKVNVQATFPPGPSLLSPESETQVLLPEVTLSWFGVSGVDEYRVQVASGSSFANVYIDEIVSELTYDIVLESSGNNWWRVAAINDCGEGDFGEEWAIEYLGLSVSELNSTNIKAFPNPGNGFITVTSKSPLGSIQISDNSGRVVAEFYLDSESETLDLSSLSAGAYFLSSLSYSGALRLVIE